ncbi:MAG: hypothetical protein OXI11_07950 [Gammaproteobacteria bacterium]|nr:hypothetical protein [Gammaproteobacteria bacterium]
MNETHDKTPGILDTPIEDMDRHITEKIIQVLEEFQQIREGLISSEEWNELKKDVRELKEKTNNHSEILEKISKD